MTLREVNCYYDNTNDRTALSCFFDLRLFLFQSQEHKAQNEQLLNANASLTSEVNRLQKELQGGGGQLTSLQDELERLREELHEAHAERKRLEEEHSTEKQELTQVSFAPDEASACFSLHWQTGKGAYLRMFDVHLICCRAELDPDHVGLRSK